MIQNYVRGLATKKGIKLSRVSIFEGHKVGCIDVHLLNIASNGKTVSTLVNQSELDDLKNGLNCECLELKIHATLSRLQVMLTP